MPDSPCFDSWLFHVAPVYLFLFCPYRCAGYKKEGDKKYSDMSSFSVALVLLVREDFLHSWRYEEMKFFPVRKGLIRPLLTG